MRGLTGNIIKLDPVGRVTLPKRLRRELLGDAERPTVQVYGKDGRIIIEPYEENAQESCQLCRCKCDESEMVIVAGTKMCFSCYEKLQKHFYRGGKKFEL